MGEFPVHGKKPLLRNKKKKKCDRSTQLSTRLATWNARLLYKPGGLRITINELIKYKIEIAAIQETRWNKFTPQHLYIGIPAVLPIIMNSFGTAFL
jgi:hypothetical protein